MGVSGFIIGGTSQSSAEYRRFVPGSSRGGGGGGGGGLLSGASPSSVLSSFAKRLYFLRRWGSHS